MKKYLLWLSLFVTIFIVDSYSGGTDILARFDEIRGRLHPTANTLNTASQALHDKVGGAAETTYDRVTGAITNVTSNNAVTLTDALYGIYTQIGGGEVSMTERIAQARAKVTDDANRSLNDALDDVNGQLGGTTGTTTSARIAQAQGIVTTDTELTLSAGLADTLEAINGAIDGKGATVGPVSVFSDLVGRIQSINITGGDDVTDYTAIMTHMGINEGDYPNTLQGCQDGINALAALLAPALTGNLRERIEAIRDAIDAPQG